MGKNNQLEQNKHEQPISLFARSLITGFIGGLIWGGLGTIMYFFSFSEVAPKSYLIRSWSTEGWTEGWLGSVLAILLVGIISILTALIYYLLFKKINSMWVGIAFGLVIWALVFYILQPIFPNIPEITDLNRYTIVSTICLFTLYGTFIGYSISYDYNEVKIRKKWERKQTASD